jgi:hypothetical protein
MRRLLPLIALSIAVPAGAEVVSVTPAGFVSRHVGEVMASPIDAWKDLIAPGRWWSSEHTYSGDAANMYIDAQATGCFCELLPLPKDAPEGSRRGSIEHMHVVYADPGRVLRLQGGLGPLQSEAVNGTLTITLKETEGKTRVLFEYVVGGFMRQEPEKMAPLVDMVLGEQFKRLTAKLSEAVPATNEAPAGESPTEP